MFMNTTPFIYPPEYQPKDPDLMKWQLATFDLIEEMKHELRCEMWNEEKKAWLRPEKMLPLVNEIGINGLMGFVTSMANKNTILSNLKENDINEIMMVLCDRIADHMFLNWQEYKITKENMDMVFGKLEMFCFMSLKRAQDEGERQFLKQTERRTEIFRTGDEQQKQKLPGWLGFGGGNK